MVYLPKNLGRIEDKYQDLFSSILALLTNVFIYDISSKYLRSTSGTESSRKQKRSYLVMNSCGG